MIHFEIDGVEYTAEIVTLAEFEDEYYDDAILEGASFLSPDGQTYVVLAPKRANEPGDVPGFEGTREKLEGLSIRPNTPTTT